MESDIRALLEDLQQLHYHLDSAERILGHMESSQHGPAGPSTRELRRMFESLCSRASLLSAEVERHAIESRYGTGDPRQARAHR